MTQSRSAVSTLMWLCLFFLLGALVTWAAFSVFIPRPDRGMTFYISLSLVCATEFIFFAHLAHSKLAEAGVATTSTATRIQVHVLIFIWFLLTVIAAAIASSPTRADTAAADKVLVIHLILTFLFFAGAYFLYAKDIELEKVDTRLEQERRKTRLNVHEIEAVIREVDGLGRRHGTHAVLADRLCKKLDSVRTGLEAAFVSERELTEQGEGGEGWAAQIERQVAQLVSLSREASTLAPDVVPERLGSLAEQADAILDTLREREGTLTS